MGGGAAARIGFEHPEYFDAVGVLGTPYSDHRSLWKMVRDGYLGGFCSLDQLENVMSTKGVDALDDMSDPDVFCGAHDTYPISADGPVALGPPIVDGTECYPFVSDFHHWYRGPDAGRGGTFDRNSLINVVHDIVAAFGNPLYANDESLYFPPGVSPLWRRTPGKASSEVAQLCENPISVPGVFNREYNPTGEYNAITFCDGAAPETGVYDPSHPDSRSRPMEFLLAVDLNGNGVRDYGEPILMNDHERFVDHGGDGLSSADEPGFDVASNPDPSGDDYHPMNNPMGTEGNGFFDVGESYDDDGLDGVAGTGDFGEGNDIYDQSPGLETFLASSPTTLFDAMSKDQVERLHIWMDAGVRDFLNSGHITNSLFSHIAARKSGAKVYDGFGALVGEPNYAYQTFKPDYSEESLGKAPYIRYGNTELCPNTNSETGSGNHTGSELIDRLISSAIFLSQRMPVEGRDDAINGPIEELGSERRAISDFTSVETMFSTALGRDVNYGVALPPDYFLNTEREYPVLYYLHGQGQTAEDLLKLGYLFFTSMKESADNDRFLAGKSDMSKMIIVFADASCEQGECWTGNLYQNFEGLPRRGTNYEDAFLELMGHVEKTLRVRRPALRPRNQ